jgi:hypothetical protein
VGQLIQGRIIDKISHEPLPLANIKLGLRGTISSNEGYFKILIKEIDHQRNNKLIISYIGFKQEELSINGLKGPVIIEMESTEKHLDEVKITNGAEEIIKNAIKNFALNYAEKSYAMFGSQSEELENQNQAKIYYLEAELQSIMPKFQSGKKIKIELKNLRQKNFSNSDSSNFVIWGATGRAIEYFDISSAYYSVLDSTKLKKYRFVVEELIIANRPVYKISFTDRKIKGNSKESYLLIEKSSYAILSFAIEAVNNDNIWAIMHQSVIRVDYQKLHEKWYLKSMYHEHKSFRWPFNKNKFDRLKIKVHIDLVDTIVNFDIDYAKNIQRADILYLKVQEKLTNKDSIKLKTIQSIPSKKKNRFVKFWYQNVSIGKTLSTTPLNSSSNSFDIRFLEKKWHLDMSYQIPTKPINPILIGFSIEIKVGKAIKLLYDGATNLGIGGRQINHIGLGIKFEKIFHPDKRPSAVYISPQVGVLIEKIPIQGLQTFTSSQYEWMNLKAEPIQMNFNKAVPILSIALGYSYEISRKKHLNFEIQYNYASKEVNSLSINDPATSIFFGQNRILTSTISNHQINNINFSIKLF